MDISNQTSNFFFEKLNEFTELNINQHEPTKIRLEFLSDSKAYF